MRILLLLILLLTGPALASEAVVKDGDTIQIGSVVYNLAGIDAPEVDQPCLDNHADNWACGIEARDRLAKLIGGREVRCTDLAGDKAYKNGRLGVCTVVGETVSLNQAMIRAGYGVSFVSAKAAFQADEATAAENKQGLWSGCFVAPADFRSKTTDGKLLGASCPPDKEKEVREALFPADLPMPSGCNIRAKQVRRARLTGNVGVYLIPQCRNYATQPKPDRWFCSEDDARAAGYRKAFNCGASGSRK